MTGGQARQAPATQLRSLTSLRFFAASWVMLYHFSDQLSFHLQRWLPLYHGPRGVDFFFVLSGFILAHVYGGQLRTGSFSSRAFFVKRFARLYPVHVVTMFAALGIFLVAALAGMRVNNAEKYDMAQFLPNLFLLQAWLPFFVPSFNGAAWSISAEAAAYILFPFVGAVILNSKRGVWFWLCVNAVILAILLLFAQFFLHRALFQMFRLGVLRIIPLFLFGVILWRGWFERRFVLPKWVLAPALAAVLLLSWQPLATMPLFGAIILAGAEMDLNGRAGRWAAPVLVFLGEASYSLYMTSNLVQSVYFTALRKLGVPMHHIGVSIVCFAIGLGIAIAVAIFTYLWIEKPARRRITRWLDLDEPREAPTVI